MKMTSCGYRMTPWELRGYLAYPTECNKPAPGTREAMNWNIGWLRAQREKIDGAKSQYHLHLENVSERDQISFAF